MTELDKKYLKWIGYNDYEIETYEGESYKETNQYDAYMAGYAQGEADEKFRTKPIVIKDKWHMTEKEDLPEITDKNRTVLYLAWTSYGVGGSPAIIRPLKKKYMNLWTGAILDKKDIVAWKECELPYF